MGRKRGGSKMLYLIADSDGEVSEVIVAKDFSEAYRKIEENNGELVIELDEETLSEIDRLRKLGEGA